jgi:hypothetical protein
MNDKRKVLLGLGWTEELVDAFLQSGMATGIEAERSGISAAVYAAVYTDQTNLLVDTRAPAILNGTALEQIQS